MTELAKEIHRRALELMYYIAANTTSNEEYESALSQAAIDLLDEAVAFEDAAGIGPEPWDDDKALAEALDTGDDYEDEFNPFDDTDENIWWGSVTDDDLDEDDLDDNEYWDQFNDEDDEDDELEDDTDYRQQADGRVL